MRGDLALAGIDGNGRRVAQGRHRRHVVEPVARLLEPGDVERLHQPRKAFGAAPVPAPVGVHRQHELRSRALAAGRHALRVLLGQKAAHLHLAARHAPILQLAHFPAQIVQRLAVLVVAADGENRERLARAAHQARHADAVDAPEAVPDRAVHAGNRLQQQFGSHGCAGHAGEHPVIVPAPVAQVPAYHQRRQNLLHQPRDLASFGAVVAVIDFRSRPVPDRQPGDDRAAGRHRIGAAAKDPRQRNFYRYRFDSLDDHAGRLRQTGKGAEFASLHPPCLMAA